MCVARLFNSNNFATSAFSAEVCALLSVIRVLIWRRVSATLNPQVVTGMVPFLPAPPSDTVKPHRYDVIRQLLQYNAAAPRIGRRTLL